MNKINIAELLRDCPQGMELDCTMFENVTFEGIKQDEYPIIVKTKEPSMTLSLTETGGWNLFNGAKCVIFPKGKTTWEGFAPPCKFKDGDIVYIKTKSRYTNEFIIIFKEIKNDYIHRHVCFTYKVLYTSLNAVCHLVNIEEMRLATEVEKAKLFDAIKANGYKWNPETKILEKLIVPKFNVGDRIKLNNSRFVYTITVLLKDRYRATTDSRDLYEIKFERQDAYILVPNKFDINTLIPFESKVLVRDTEEEKWKPAIWGYYDDNNTKYYPYETVGGNCFQLCIPYDKNEHLLNTTNDCNDFYKTWE